jgi:glycosyltransferase involved in cell wall biosynthesis
MRVALHNIHRLPDLQFHSYVYDLLRLKLIRVLYFSDPTGITFVKHLVKLAKQQSLRNNYKGINWRDFDFVFTVNDLNQKADVLLNLNLMCFTNTSSEFPSSLSKFQGLKIFHVGDYFWYRPGSVTNKLLRSIGVDHLLGYAMHDRYCSYFQKYFPDYHEKVWGIPFGFTPRFVSEKPFEERLSKAVALGSVNPLRPLHEPVYNYLESADHFPDECWFHKFRRQLVLNKDGLSGVMDSMLPEFPLIKDFKYDLVAKFNEYQMFVTCESIMYFPSAKVFEGMACETAVICADLECNKEYGLEDGKNCIMFEPYNLDDFKEKVQFYQADPKVLAQIASEGYRFVKQNYSKHGVALKILETAELIFQSSGSIVASPMRNRLG